MTLEELTHQLHASIPQFDCSRHEIVFELKGLELPVLDTNGLRIDTISHEANLYVDEFKKDGFQAKVIVVLREA